MCALLINTLPVARDQVVMDLRCLFGVITIKPITLPHIKIAGNSNKEFEALSLETELNKERTGYPSIRTNKGLRINGNPYLVRAVLPPLLPSLHPRGDFYQSSLISPQQLCLLHLMYNPCFQKHARTDGRRKDS